MYVLPEHVTASIYDFSCGDATYWKSQFNKVIDVLNELNAEFWYDLHFEDDEPANTDEAHALAVDFVKQWGWDIIFVNDRNSITKYFLRQLNKVLKDNHFNFSHYIIITIKETCLSIMLDNIGVTDFRIL